MALLALYPFDRDHSGLGLRPDRSLVHPRQRFTFSLSPWPLVSL
jgi:hypothetical protein